MERRKQILILLFLCGMLVCNSCLEDSVQPEINVSLQSSAQLLSLLEERGDYINTTGMPSLISAEDLYNNLHDYLLLDIRDSVKFQTGHIEGAVNILPESIPSYLNKNNLGLTSPIVIVSSAGQSASYYTCLLRLSGYSNSFALSFGMASWNNDFADIWRNAIDAQIDSARMDNASYLKPSFTDLPSAPSVDSLNSAEELLDYRITQQFKDTFSEQLSYTFTPVDTTNMDPEVSLRTAQFYHDFKIDFSGYNSYFVICFGPGQLYAPYGYIDKFPDLRAHPVASVYYQNAEIRSDLQSISHLQTIPTNKIIAVYSISGHASAFIAAYLRVLGYKAKSIIFGANSFVYLGMGLHDVLMQRSFSENTIMNFPYRTGTP